MKSISGSPFVSSRCALVGVIDGTGIEMVIDKIDIDQDFLK